MHTLLASAGRLAAVELVDAHLCSDAGKFLAALLLSLSSMLHLELPHVNVLSKADLVEELGDLDHELDDYAEACVPRQGNPATTEVPTQCILWQLYRGL